MQLYMGNAERAHQ